MLALLFFIAHVALLFTSFGKTAYNKRRYAWSHYTLWICGIIVYVAAVLNARGDDTLGIFNTPLKQLLILVVVAVLSLVAHTIVRKLVLPKYKAGIK
ncbi:hypothetical protein DCM91_15185 [Chitinophaga costaii]|nr:hypothetical protein DCM91_15185 [Chitinophaga costaii]